MAQIVSIIGITHNPFMPRLFKQAQQPPGAAKVKERIAMMRQKLAEAKVDVLVCIGNDYLHQFFMDNMPAFMIGKMGSTTALFTTRNASLACRSASSKATSTSPTPSWRAPSTAASTFPIPTN